MTVSPLAWVEEELLPEASRDGSSAGPTRPSDRARKVVGLTDDARIRERIFSEIYVQNRDSIYSLCLRRLGDPVLAEDVVQDTFLRAYQNLWRFDWSKPVLPWLAVIAGRRCIDVQRRGQSARESTTGSPQVLCAEVLLAECGSEVEDAVERLPEAQRKVLLLRAHHDMTLAEIAAIEGTSAVVVKGLLQRARESVRRTLSACGTA